LVAAHNLSPDEDSDALDLADEPQGGLS